MVDLFQAVALVVGNLLLLATHLRAPTDVINSYCLFLQDGAPACCDRLQERMELSAPEVRRYQNNPDTLQLLAHWMFGGVHATSGLIGHTRGFESAS